MIWTSGRDSHHVVHVSINFDKNDDDNNDENHTSKINAWVLLDVNMYPMNLCMLNWFRLLYLDLNILITEIEFLIMSMAVTHLKRIFSGKPALT
jgi:hypothetical protein